MTRQQEDNIMGWAIIMIITLFVVATCQASQNQESNVQTQETK